VVAIVDIVLSNDDDILVTISSTEADKSFMLADMEDDTVDMVSLTDDDIDVMFSPPLVREPVTKRLWTFICK
jgi:hypothetical protein